MQERKTVTDKKRLVQLIEEFTPEQQSAVLMFLEAMNCACSACSCDIEKKLANAPPGSTLTEAGIDAQDWVNHLRGHRCG